MPASATPAQTAWLQRVLDVTLGTVTGGPGVNPAIYAKARLAWIAARTKIEGDVAKLHDALAAAYATHGGKDDLEKAFRSSTGTMLSTLDHSLADKLDEVNKATDAAQRGRLVREARQIMQRYVAYVGNEPIIAKLDANPFVPVAIGKTLTATLATLSSTVR